MSSEEVEALLDVLHYVNEAWFTGSLVWVESLLGSDATELWEIRQWIR